MDRDAIGAKALGVHCSFNDIRVIAAPAIAQGSKFVDIYRKFSHGGKGKK
jgi:hypothetical protein